MNLLTGISRTSGHMMDAITNLHTKARRYCGERNEYWRENAQRIATPPFFVDNGGRSTSLRHHILAAIIAEVEGFVPQDFSDFDEAKTLIALAGQTADNLFTKSVKDPVEMEVIQEERDAFTTFVQRLTISELIDVEPLPIRRVLTKAESKEIWAGLQQTWGIQPRQSYWYPLLDCNVENVEAFDVYRFIESEIFRELPNFFLEKKSSRLYELPEIGDERELDITMENQPFYHGIEIYWTTKNFDTVLYISHEETLAVGGWLLDEIKRMYPEWQSLVWSPPEF
ncbi:MAG: hypothetical protein KJ069_01555 [Anaerolineae bacterium]|nr:hypothetical protein [Anaerolineae bacterium]